MESDKSVSNGLRDAAASSNQLDTDQADLGGKRLQMEILAQLQIALIASVGPMLRNMCQVGQGGENPRITQAGNHGTAKLIKLGIVVTHVTLNIVAKFKNTFVQTVWLGAGRWGIQKGNVHTKNKT